MTQTARNTKKSKTAEPHRFFFRPADTSLAAYKEWIRGISTALRAQAGLPAEDEGLTEEEWVRDWKDFWKGTEKEP